MFLMSDYGSDCDDLEASYILTEESCKEAAEDLQLKWIRSLDSNLRQKGCYSSPKRFHDKVWKEVYFNNATDQNTDDGRPQYLAGTQSICKNGITLAHTLIRFQ